MGCPAVAMVKVTSPRVDSLFPETPETGVILLRLPMEQQLLSILINVSLPTYGRWVV